MKTEDNTNYWADLDDFIDHVEAIVSKQGIDRAREYIATVYTEGKRRKRKPLDNN